MTTIEHLAAQDCADRANREAENGQYKLDAEDVTKTHISPALKALFKFRIEVAEMAEELALWLTEVCLDANAYKFSEKLNSFRLTAPAPVDPKDARIAELEARVVELENPTSQPLDVDPAPPAPAEYGKVHTDGSRSGGQPPAVDPDLIEAREVVRKFDGSTSYLQMEHAYLAALRSRPKQRLLTEDDVRGVLCEGWSYSTIADHLNTILEGPAS